LFLRGFSAHTTYKMGMDQPGTFANFLTTFTDLKTMDLKLFLLLAFDHYTVSFNIKVRDFFLLYQGIITRFVRGSSFNDLAGLDHQGLNFLVAHTPARQAINRFFHMTIHHHGT